MNGMYQSLMVSRSWVRKWRMLSNKGVCSSFSNNITYWCNAFLLQSSVTSWNRSSNVQFTCVYKHTFFNQNYNNSGNTLHKLSNLLLSINSSLSCWNKALRHCRHSIRVGRATFQCVVTMSKRSLNRKWQNQVNRDQKRTERAKVTCSNIAYLLAYLSQQVLKLLKCLRNYTSLHLRAKDTHTSTTDYRESQVLATLSTNYNTWEQSITSLRPKVSSEVFWRRVVNNRHTLYRQPYDNQTQLEMRDDNWKCLSQKVEASCQMSQ